MSAMDLQLITFGVCLVINLSLIDCRQMCWTCQFQSTVQTYRDAQGKDCVFAPGNWTGGEKWLRCPDRCTVTARYDAETLTPTFFHRGCADTSQDNGCSKVATFLECFFSCGDGNNYCNDVTSFEDMKVLEEERKKKLEGGGGGGDDEITASLYCLMALTAVCATGYFVKKKYCSPEENDEELGH